MLVAVLLLYSLSLVISKYAMTEICPALCFSAIPVFMLEVSNVPELSETPFHFSIIALPWIVE